MIGLLILKTLGSSLVMYQANTIKPSELINVLNTLIDFKDTNIPFLQANLKSDEEKKRRMMPQKVIYLKPKNIDEIIIILKEKLNLCRQLFIILDSYSIKEPLSKNNLNRIRENLNKFKSYIIYFVEKIKNTIESPRNLEDEASTHKKSISYQPCFTYYKDFQTQLTSFWVTIDDLKLEIEIFVLLNNSETIISLRNRNIANKKNLEITNRIVSILIKNNHLLFQLKDFLAFKNLDNRMVIPLLFKAILNYNILTNMHVLPEYEFIFQEAVLVGEEAALLEENVALLNKKKLEILNIVKQVISCLYISSIRFDSLALDLLKDLNNEVTRITDKCLKKIKKFENEVENIIDYLNEQHDYLINQKAKNLPIEFKHKSIDISLRIDAIKWDNFKLTFEVYYQTKIITKIISQCYILLYNLLFDDNTTEYEFITKFPMFNKDRKQDICFTKLRSINRLTGNNYSEEMCILDSRLPYLLNSATMKLDINQLLITYRCF